MTGLRRQARRFVLVGGVNTAVTTAMFAVLASVIDPTVAYTIVFALGIVFSTVVTNRYVFSAGTSWPRMALFAGWYLVVYGVGVLVVRLLDHSFHWPALPLAIATVCITAPLSFLGGRLVFHRPDPVPAPEQELTL